MKMDEIKDLNKEHCEVMASDLIKEKEKKPEQNDEKVFTIFMTSVFIFFICIISFILISEIGLNKNLPLDKLIFVTVLTLILIFGISLSLENRRVRKIYEKNLIALQNDKDYQIAKKIVHNFFDKEKKFFIELKKEKEIKEVLIKEQEKSILKKEMKDDIEELENYIKISKI